MLVLSRKKNEAIVIPGIGNIVIVEIRGDKVRVGAEANQSILVHPKEVWDQILASKRKELEAANDGRPVPDEDVEKTAIADHWRTVFSKMRAKLLSQGQNQPVSDEQLLASVFSELILGGIPVTELFVQGTVA